VQPYPSLNPYPTPYPNPYPYLSSYLNPNPYPRPNPNPHPRPNPSSNSKPRPNPSPKPNPNPNPNLTPSIDQNPSPNHIINPNLNHLIAQQFQTPILPIEQIATSSMFGKGMNLETSPITTEHLPQEDIIQRPPEEQSFIGIVLKMLLKLETLESLSTILVNLKIKYLSLNLRDLPFVFHHILCASRKVTIKL